MASPGPARSEPQSELSALRVFVLAWSPQGSGSLSGQVYFPVEPVTRLHELAARAPQSFVGQHRALLASEQPGEPPLLALPR